MVDFTGEQDEKEKEKWALDFFKENLLRQWFEPTLTPGQVTGGFVQPESLDSVFKRGNELRPAATPAPPRPEFTGSTTAKPESKSPTEGTGNGDAAAATIRRLRNRRPPLRQVRPKEPASPSLPINR
ncbi:hypothetical protein [Cohnella faecalis]|uniref:hypothetical protein n=1 Tax=Cohnella faecalis TaxID=2315694 RepID=UPI0011C2132F|nr:hypothetical protein [Cohnella faecalis]